MQRIGKARRVARIASSEPTGPPLPPKQAEFKEQGWLSGDEISVAVKAYRMLKADQDIDELVEMFNFLRGDK